MDIETAGAIRLFFPNPSLALVYFEALANALDAGATDVSIDIDVQAFDKPDTLKITASDNDMLKTTPMANHRSMNKLEDELR